jgi:Flp pilus assembly pilin Flp
MKTQLTKFVRFKKVDHSQRCSAWRSDTGATLLEYALALALIILILVWSYRGFLQSVDNKYENDLNQLNQVGPVPLLNLRP